MRRAAAKVSATASSAVVSVRMPGVLPTASPSRRRRRQVDVVVADRVVAEHPAAGALEAFEQRGVPLLGELGDDAVAGVAHDGGELGGAQRAVGAADLDAAAGGH